MKKYYIKSVADALGLRYKKRGDADSLYYFCPFCGDKKGKLNLNIKKQTWRCNRCEEGGGVTRLVEAYRECSHEEALTWLSETSGVLSETVATANSYEPENKIADENILDATYRAMLKLLKLKKIHQRDLLRRGLNESAIAKLGFKSMPDKETGKTIALKLFNSGYTLDGVPGFYKAYGKWRMQDLPGYLIPFINVNGKITGMQIHVDKPGNGGGKYMSLTSTGKNCGTKSAIQAHLIGYKNQCSVYLTEGGLKADVACYLSYIQKHRAYAFLAIPGVSNSKTLKNALEELKARGVTKVYNCFDMDRVGNQTCAVNSNVQRSILKLKNIVSDVGLDWKDISWETEKGIDDYLLYLQKN